MVPLGCSSRHRSTLCRMVKKLMPLHNSKISAVHRIVRNPELGRRRWSQGETSERAGHGLCPDDFARCGHECYTGAAHARGTVHYNQ